MAYHYIRDGADNTTGNDWEHAWTDLPTTFIRGDTYFIASGSYGSHSFPVLAGISYVYLKKATVASHGTDTGWLNSYATGQAIFSAAGTVWNISMSYLDVDGITGSGKSDYGIRLNSSSVTDGIGAIYSAVASPLTNGRYIIFRHVEANNAPWGPPKNLSRVVTNQSTWPDGAYDWTFQNCYFHGGRVWIGFSGKVTNLLIEGCYFYNAGSGSYDSDAHSAGLTLANGNNVTIRYNIYENFKTEGGTCYIEPQFTCSNFYIYGNVFWASVTRDYEGTTQGVYAVTSTDTVTNCHFYNNTAYNLHTNGATTGFWSGNISGSSHYVRNNVWKNCEDVQIYDMDANIVSQSNNILDGAGVTFVDAANGDFHLSSATVAGYTLSSPYNEDPDGMTRGADGIWDRGAYEYDSGSDPEESAIKFARIG